MLMQTNIQFMGMRIWLDGDNKTHLKQAQARLERWILEYIGNPPKFTTVGKTSASTRLSNPKRFRNVRDKAKDAAK